MINLIVLNQRASDKWGLNINEALIFSCICSKSPLSPNSVIDGVKYLHFTRAEISDSLPILNFKPDTVYRYLKSLSEKGLIEWINGRSIDLIRISDKGMDWTLGFC